MLSPKRVKFRKMFKGRTTGLAYRGSEVSFGHYGLQRIHANVFTGTPPSARVLERSGFSLESTARRVAIKELKLVRLKSAWK